MSQVPAHTIIGALIFVATIGLIMVRPRQVTEAIAAAIGALLMLLGRFAINALIGLFMIGTIASLLSAISLALTVEQL